MIFSTKFSPILICAWSLRRKSVWLDLPFLIFISKPISSLVIDSRSNDLLMDFVTRVLFLRNRISQIDSISLSYATDGIDSWIDFCKLSQVKLIDVAFEVSCDKPIFILPASVLNCRTLISLSIEVLKCWAVGRNRESQAIFVDVPKFVSLPNLKYMILASFCFRGSDFVSKILNGCPTIECLKISDCCIHEKNPVRDLVICSDCVKRLEFDSVFQCDGLCSLSHQEENVYDNDFECTVSISAPMLRVFKCNGCASDTYVLRDSNSLLMADLRISDCRDHWVRKFSFDCDIAPQDFQKNMVTLLTGIQKAKHLQLSGLLIERSLSRLEESLALFTNLETVELSAIEGNDEELNFIEKLLSKAPTLKTLIFTDKGSLRYYEYAHRSNGNRYMRYCRPINHNDLLCRFSEIVKALPRASPSLEIIQV